MSRFTVVLVAARLAVVSPTINAMEICSLDFTIDTTDGYLLVEHHNFLEFALQNLSLAQQKGLMEDLVLQVLHESLISNVIYLFGTLVCRYLFGTFVCR